MRTPRELKIVLMLIFSTSVTIIHNLSSPLRRTVSHRPDSDVFYDLENVKTSLSSKQNSVKMES